MCPKLCDTVPPIRKMTKGRKREFVAKKKRSPQTKLPEALMVSNTEMTA